MKKIRALFSNYFFNLALILLFTGIVLFFTLYQNLDKVLFELKSVSVFWIALVIGLALSYQIILGWILKVLVNIFNPDYSLKKGVVNALVGTLFRGITPASGGGQVAQVYLFRKQGVKMTDSLSVLLMDFVLYQIVCVLFGLVLLLFKFNYFLDNYSAIIWLVILGWIDDSVLMFILFSLSKSPRLHKWVSSHGISILAKLRIVKDQEKTLAKLEGKLQDFQEAWKNIRQHYDQVIQVVFLNFLRLILYFAIPIFIMVALDIELSSTRAVNIFVLTAFVTMMNSLVPIPGSAGTTEAAFIYFVSNEVGYIAAVSGALIWRFATFHLILVVGALTFMLTKRYYLKKGVTE